MPKYRNHKIVNSEGVFDSQLEWSRFIFLRNRQSEGQISGLRRQVEYLLIPAQYKAETRHLKTKDKEVQVLVERPCTYKADFVYAKDGRTVVEDVKGSRFMIDQKFPIKRKLMLWVHGIELEVVTRATEWDKEK